MITLTKQEIGEALHEAIKKKLGPGQAPGRLRFRGRIYMDPPKVLETYLDSGVAMGEVVLDECTCDVYDITPYPFA